MEADFRDEEKFVENLVRYEHEEMTFEAYEEVFERIYSKVDEGNRYFRPRNPGEREVFEVLDRDADIFTNWHDDLYGLKVELDEVQDVEERIRMLKHPQEYDDIELISRLSVEAEYTGKVPSTRDARNSEHMPSEIPYINEFRDWSNAKWRAGLKGHEKLGEELMLEELVNEIHRQNSDVDDIQDYSIPTGTEIDESETAPSERSLRNSFGSYENALRETGFLRVREHAQAETGDSQEEPGLLAKDI